MLVTFFIGNGFDLNNGMKTKFTDFYDYIKNTKSTADISKNDIYTRIENDRDNWSYFEMQLGQLTIEYDEKSKIKLLEDLDEFREDFIDYMTEQNKLFSFEEKKAQQSLAKSLTQFMNQLDESEKDDIVSVYKKFPSERRFNFINFNYTNTLEQIVGLFDKKTSLATNYVGNTGYGNYLGEIIPIHKQLQNGMFLGVNDETQINSEIFSQIERASLIKPLANEEFRENTNTKVESLINKSNIVVIYGMSLGETDKKWWIYLNKWLQENENNRLIIHVRDSKFSKRNPMRYLEKRKEYEDRFIGFSYDLSDINNDELQKKVAILRKRIYLISNSKSDFKFSTSIGSMVEITT